MSLHTAGWDGSNPVEFGSTFDGRDVIARIEWLTDQLDAARDGSPLSDDPAEAETLADEYSTELAELQTLADEAAANVADWEYGETFIAEDYFQDYAEELAYDIGAIDRNASWPLNRIDWEAAADDLKIDYNEVEFTVDGTSYTYWAR